jgi:hypothetical protein
MWWRDSGKAQKRVHKQLHQFFVHRESSFHYSLLNGRSSLTPKTETRRQVCRLNFESFNQLLDVQEKHAKAFRRIVSNDPYEPLDVWSKAGLLFLSGSSTLIQTLVSARLAEPVTAEAGALVRGSV